MRHTGKGKNYKYRDRSVLARDFRSEGGSKGRASGVGEKFYILTSGVNYLHVCPKGTCKGKILYINHMSTKLT